MAKLLLLCLAAAILAALIQADVPETEPATASSIRCKIILTCGPIWLAAEVIQAAPILCLPVRNASIKPSTRCSCSCMEVILWNGRKVAFPLQPIICLRAPLANAGMPLATCWTGGSPRWYFHHMGLGETIGYSLMQSQNNTSIYDPGNNTLLGGVHMVLMGDPTLRLHMVYPVSNLTATQVACIGTIKLECFCRQ